MAIKVWDYSKEYAQEKAEIHSAIEKVLSSGQLILGENVKKFEEAVAGLCRASYGIGVNSGTDALFIGLKALGVGAGDEVITVANTAVPTVSAIVSTGATPVFVDIVRDTYLMDTAKLENVISSKTKCILPVHLYGQCVDMDVVNRIAKEHELFVLEDCAQAQGALYKGKPAGSMSDVSAFSFYPTKIIGTFGDGGMVVTDKKEYYEKAKRLRFYGMEKTYYALEHGYNSRLDELHASILLGKLTHLAQYLESRNRLAKQYDTLLADTGLILPKTERERFHAYYLYVVRHPKRDHIMEELKKRDILVNISYPWPIHTMQGYQYLGYKEGDLPETEAAAKEIFSLPMYPALSDAEQAQVCKTLHEILG